MTDEQLAAAVRDAIVRLNTSLADAARAGLAVTLHSTSHQTSHTGYEQVVVEAEIFKRL